MGFSGPMSTRFKALAPLLLAAAIWASPFGTSAAVLRPVSWQDPILVNLPDGVRVIVKDRPAGLALSHRVEQPGRYRLVVRGRGGPMTLRLRLDDGAYEYLAAPDGTLHRTLSGFRAIEILIYADAPASYDLLTVRLEPCATCRTADDLVSRVRAEVPDLDGRSGIDRILALQSWAASVSDYSHDPSLIPSDFEQREDFDALFEFFDKDLGGVSCGGMAVFARRVFQRFGIDAFTINYGVPGTRVTHVSLVVPYGDKFLLVDPTFGVFYRYGAAPLSIADGLRLIRAGKSHLIETVANQTAKRDAIVPAPWCRADASLNERARCRLGLSELWARFVAEQGSMWADAGVPLTDVPLLRLLLHGVFHIGPGTRGESRRHFIAQLRELGIPFHSRVD